MFILLNICKTIWISIDINTRMLNWRKHSDKKAYLLFNKFFENKEDHQTNY